MAFLIISIFLLFTVLFISNKTKINTRAKAIAVLSLLLLIILIYIRTNPHNKDAYEGNLEPFTSEISNIENYEKATQLILTNWERIEEEQENKSRTGLYNSSPHPLTDSIVNIQIDSLHLRFISLTHNFDVEIDNEDTTVIFNAGATDYQMITNDDQTSTLFRHAIIYTNQPKVIPDSIGMDRAPSKTIKIKENYYYQITSHIEY